MALAAPAQAMTPGGPGFSPEQLGPASYWQGLTSDPADSNLFFVGIFRGRGARPPACTQTAGVSNVIPPAVAQAEGYNHIGDPTWNPAAVGA